MEDIGLFKQGWEWVQSRKLTCGGVLTGWRCFRDKFGTYVDRYWPMVCNLFVRLGRFMLFLLVHWKNCCVRGCRSFCGMGSAALLLIMWTCFLSLTSMSCLVYVLLSMGAAGVAVQYLGYTPGLFIVGLIAILVLWMFANFWITGILFIVGGYLFSLNHARIVVLMATLYGIYCVKMRVGWLGVGLSINLSFLSNDVLNYIFQWCDNISEAAHHEEPKEPETVMEEDFPSECEYSAPPSRAEKVYSCKSSTKTAAAVATSTVVDSKKRCTAGQVVKEDTRSIDEMKRILGCKSHYEALGFPRRRKIDAAMLKKEYHKKTRRREWNYQQKFGLVNLKLKWVKDRSLDVVVAGERELRAASMLVSIIGNDPHGSRPVYHLARRRRQLGLPNELKLSTFMRRYPNIFQEFYALDSGGTCVPWFCLSPEARELYREEVGFVREHEAEIVNRVRKLLMLTADRLLPLQTIDQLRWDFGLPSDYHCSIIPQYPDLFSLTKLSDDRVGLKLLTWDDSLAVSQLQQNAIISQQGKEKEKTERNLMFPISFTRGYGLKRKCMEWLSEWQTLPYTSPYVDASHLDPRTDVSEKRIVGVFHELLHLTIQKKTERKNVSNLRKPLALPQKFTKVFERHPGIFYISKKCDTQTVVLREAYVHSESLQKHPLVEIREKLASMMRQGLLDRSRGLYKKSKDSSQKNISDDQADEDGSDCEGDSESDTFSEYDSDEAIKDLC